MDFQESEQNSSKDFSSLPKVTFDDVLKELGEFGPYQRKYYILLFLPTIFSAIHSFVWVFLGAVVPHRCRFPDEPFNSSYDLSGFNQSEMIPYMNNKSSQCSRYDAEMQEIPCDHGWIYDTTTFGSSTLIEWNLVCQDQWMRAAGQSLYMIGAFFGSYFFGKASVRFGRRKTFIFAAVGQSLFGISAGAMPSYWPFIAVRMMIGMTSSGIFVTSHALAMEMVGPKYRLVAGTVREYFYILGYFLITLVAYFLNSNWRLLQIVMSAPSAIFVIYWWLIPESVRWLITKGRYDESKAIIKKISATNGTFLSEELVSNMFLFVIEESNSSQKNSNLRVRDLLKQARFRRYCLCMFYIWFVIYGTYYGLTLFSPDLGGNPYINFLIAAAVEIPANTLVLLILNKFGRKIPLSAFLTVAGVVLLIAIFIHESNYTILVILSVIGKFSITICLNIAYTFTGELFPTTARSQALGMCYLFSRIGCILCPFLNMLVSIWHPLPLIAYGVFGVTAGLVSLMLPETLNKKLPETIDDGENVGNQNLNGKEKNESKAHEITKL